MNPHLQRAAIPFLPLNLLPFDPADFSRHGPRDYQLDILYKVVPLVQQGYRRILVQLPTGAGKTVLATALLASASRAQFIVHRKELIDQTSKTFWRAKVPHSFVAADRPMDVEAQVLLCGIVTLAERLGIVLPPDIICWDEAHHLNASTWADVMGAYPDALHIGLTATPQRLDGQGLGDHFQVMVLGPSVKELIGAGYLSEFDYYGPPFDPNAEAALVGDVVEHYLRHAPGEPGLVFASSRDHSRELVAAFQSAGITALHVDGSMSSGARTVADAMFRAGEAKIFSNVSIAGEGYDVPNVVYCGIARRTQSLSWFLQMAGRALRTAPGKSKAVICDHGGNWQIHGFPDDDRAWTLDGRLKGVGVAGGNTDADPIHQCLECYRVTKSTVKVCPGCGTEFPAQRRNFRQTDGELLKIERETAREAAEAERKRAARARKQEERACESHADFVALAERRGYDNAKGWARMKMQLRQNWKR